MGQFDEEIAAEPSENGSEPIGGPPEEQLVEQVAETTAQEPVEQLLSVDSLVEGSTDEALVHEPEEVPAIAEEDPIAAIQDQLALEEPEGEPAREATGAEPGVEPITESAPSDDDLAAAVAAASEQVGTEGTLDDIAPGTTHATPDDDVEGETLVRYGAPWWPFLIYLALWIAFAGVAVWQLRQLPNDVIVYETEQYTMFVFGGLALAASGVFLVFAVWLGARISPKRQRKGLFSSSLVMGALSILIGVVLWWGAIMALDYLRLGRLI